MSLTPDKIESIQKVGETMGGNPVDPIQDMERVAPNKEHFQSLINATQPTQNSFDKMNTQPLDAPDAPEKNPILTEDSSTSEKSGSATDQEGKQKKQKDDDEIEGVEKTGSKRKSSLESSLVGNDLQQVKSKVDQMARMSPEELKSQAGEIISQFESAKKKLNQTNEIKPSYHTVLRNKLSHIDDNLKIALSKAGIEYSAADAPSGASRKNPVKEFIDSLTNSQNEMKKVYDSLSNYSGSETLSTAAMLTIQIKMHHIQQQMELFSNLLNKVLESAKTIMNVQV